MVFTAGGRFLRPLFHAALPICGSISAGAEQRRWIHQHRPSTQCEEQKIESLETKICRLETENQRLQARLQQLDVQEAAPIYRIVVTGGPCAGKTTATTTLRERLENAGWRVFTVPEAATMLFHNGARFLDFLHLGEVGIVHFQTQLAKLQIRLEDTMHDMAAASGAKSVLLCDRGVMDGKAYISQQGWALVLDALGMTEAQARDRRYDAVIHLVTAAEGAEQYYTLEQAEGSPESSRTETIEEAREQDHKTSQAWVGHEHLHIIDNTSNFRRKMDRTADRVLKTIGEPVVGHTLRKIRLPYMTALEIQDAAKEAGVASTRIFKCITTYVSPTARIRLRSDPDLHGASYLLQTFREDTNSHTMRRATERFISSWSYMQSLKDAHAAGYKSLEKELVCFTWQGVVYEINVFRYPSDMCILEVEAESRDSNIIVPPFLRGCNEAAEVTRDPLYDTRSIARVKAGGP